MVSELPENDQLRMLIENKGRFTRQGGIDMILEPFGKKMEATKIINEKNRFLI